MIQKERAANNVSPQAVSRKKRSTPAQKFWPSGSLDMVAQKGGHLLLTK